MTRSGEKGQQTDGGNGTDGGWHNASRRVRPRVSSLGVVAFQQRVANNDDRKAALPEHVEPSAGLRAGPEQTIARKQAGKGRHMGQRHQSSEEVSARSNEDSAQS